MSILGAAWIAAVARLGGDAGAATVSADELDRRYGEPRRVYHNAAHVEAMLRDTAQLAPAAGLDTASAALVTLAVCAHDVVYDGRPGEDERASAAWARDRLTTLGLPAGYAERVDALVQSTADHASDPHDVARSVLNDADLAILAAPPEEYRAYTEAVRREYRELDDAQWTPGRSAALSSLLRMPRLYVTEIAHARWEDAARANVQAELDELGRG
ncbi:MAG: HD domain-containing protein [Jatrophihabitans sp.]